MTITLPKKIKGALLATFAAIFLTISITLTKQLNSELSTFLIAFIRSLFGLIFLTPVLIFKRKEIKKPHNLPLHLIRITIVCLATLCTYYAYRNLPIVFATSIGMTAPLFVTLLSILVLKEKIGKYRWLLLCIGYGGVLIIIKPHSFIFEIAILVALLANLLAASSNIMTKLLLKNDSTTTVIMISNTGVMLLSGLLAYHTDWDILTQRDLMILTCTGFLGVTAQSFLVSAIKYAPPSFIAPFEYTRIVYATFIGIFIFHETINMITMLGSFIIIASTYGLTYLERKD